MQPLLLISAFLFGMAMAAPVPQSEEGGLLGTPITGDIGLSGPTGNLDISGEVSESPKPYKAISQIKN